MVESYRGSKYFFLIGVIPLVSTLLYIYSPFHILCRYSIQFGILTIGNFETGCSEHTKYIDKVLFILHKTIKC